MIHRLILGFAIALSLVEVKAGEKLGAAAEFKSSKGIQEKENLARLAFKKKQPQKVIDLLISHLYEVSRSSQLILAQSLHDQKKYEEEIRVLELVLKLTPEDHLVLARLGNAYAELKKTDEATRSFRLAIKFGPKYLPAYESLLYLFETTDNYYEARLVLKDMTKVFGSKPDFLHELCRIDSLDGYLESSSKACLEAIYRDPQHPDSYVYLANNYRDAGEKVKAQKAYIDAAKRFGGSEFVQSAAGLYFSENHDFHAAFRFFSQAVRADSKSVRALSGLAKSALEIGEYKISLDNYVRACRLDKSVARDFRHAATQLRVKQVYKWSGDFDAKSNLCRLHDN